MLSSTQTPPRHVEVRECPVCGGAGEFVIRNARDHITGLQGGWSFRECRGCGSLWQDPCPAKEEIGRLYPENYHFTHSASEVWVKQRQRLAGSAKIGILEQSYGYRGLRGQAASRAGLLAGKVAAFLGLGRSRGGQAVRFLKSKPGGRLLDVGCGSGMFLSLMKELGWTCGGVEPDPVAAAVARSLGHDVQDGTIEDARLPENHFDAVTLSHVMEHFPKPAEALAAIARVLKPGGVFVSLSPNPAGIIRRCFGADWYNLDAPRHLVLPSGRGYEVACSRAGLHARCWTSTNLTFWALKESASIRRSGAVGGPAKPGLKLLSSVLGLLRPLAKDLGEEVVCHAVKQ